MQLNIYRLEPVDPNKSTHIIARRSLEAAGRSAGKIYGHDIKLDDISQPQPASINGQSMLFNMLPIEDRLAVLKGECIQIKDFLAAKRREIHEANQKG